METLKPSQNPPFPFPHHRRRPLQSETYRIFAQIMSHCNALQSVPQHKKRGKFFPTVMCVSIFLF